MSRVVGKGGPALLSLDSVLFDPERPHMSPDDLLKERGGKMVDRDSDRHCCPFCNRIMADGMKVRVLFPNDRWQQFTAPFSGYSDTSLATRINGPTTETAIFKGHVYYLRGPATVYLQARGLFSEHLEDCFRRNYSTIGATRRAFRGASIGD